MTVLTLSTQALPTPTFTKYAKVTATSVAAAVAAKFCLNDERKTTITNRIEQTQKWTAETTKNVIYTLCTTNHFMAAVESYPRFRQDFQNNLFGK